MNDILFTPLRLNELETLIEKSFERVLLRINTTPQAQNTPQSDRILIDEVERITGLKRATIYSKKSKGELPAHKTPGQKAVFFLRSEILDWLQSGRPTIAAQAAENYIYNSK